MIANDVCKVAIIFSAKDLGKYWKGKQVFTSHGPGLLVTYDDFNKLFFILQKFNIDNFVTLDQDRFMVGHGPMFDKLPKERRLKGMDQSLAFTKDFYLKDSETNIYYGLF